MAAPAKHGESAGPQIATCPTAQYAKPPTKVVIRFHARRADDRRGDSRDPRIDGDRLVSPLRTALESDGGLQPARHDSHASGELPLGVQYLLRRVVVGS